jgi:ABC-2 type transport system permease protein
LWAKKITIGLFAICTLVWVMLAFALNLDIVEGSLAGLRIFGAEATPSEVVRDPDTGEVVTDPASGDALREIFSLERIVVEVERVVAVLSYWAGILLALFATASLLPSLLAPGRIDLLLSKPISRARLLGGHLLGVFLTMLVVAVYLFGMVWLVMSWKTGIWRPHFFQAMLLVVGMFGVMYSVVALIGVTARSAPLALLVAYGLMFASWILAAKDQLVPQIKPPWRQVFLGFYHVLPNFGEVTVMVVQLTGGEDVASWYPLLSSLAFGAVFFAATFLFFTRRDF